jgi:hypothetical protein
VDASSARNPTDILAREASAKIDPTIPFEPQKLWDEAYDALSNQDPGLLKAYERVLNRELNQNLDEEQKNPRESPQANLVQNDDLEMRRSQMKQLVQGGLKKTEKEARLKQNVGGVIDIAKDAITLISVALQACPQAALPLAGVTLAIQVSLTYR